MGTGRFATALSLDWGIDPSEEMLRLARKRGCRVLRGEGEHLPFADAGFGWVLMVTVLCFVRDPGRVIGEAFRVLRPGGRLILGIIDPQSELGQAPRRSNPSTAGAVSWSSPPRRRTDRYPRNPEIYPPGSNSRPALPLATESRVNSFPPGD